MLFETVGQARIFLVAAAVGAAAGLFYDGMSLARAKLGKKGEYITEALFVLSMGTLIIGAASRVRTPLRGYVVLGSAVGWFLYAVTVSGLLHWLIGFLRKKRKKKKESRN